MADDHVNIVEVGPRDGLQNESVTLATDRKIVLIEKLVEAGLSQIEVTSFVHPQAVPQLADAAEVIRGLPAAPEVTFSALVPNQKGLDRAIESGVKRVVVFTAASETFTQKNIRMSIAESFKVIEQITRRALDGGMTVRGYLSTCFVCPYEGEISKERVLELTQQLLDLGVDEVAISDTIGAAVPKDVHQTIDFILAKIPVERIALHFHDTYGTALANVCAGLQRGVRTFDASLGGLGGCPFAPGAAGNLATEDLIYLLDRMGFETGVNLDKVIEAVDIVAADLNRPPNSKQWQRLKAPCQKSTPE